MEMKLAEVRRLARADLPQVVTVMARAFQHDPLWVYLYPDDARRARAMPPLFRSLLGLWIDNGQAYGVGNPVQGVAVWTLPEQPRPTFLQYLRAGLRAVLPGPLLIPAIQSVRVFARIRVVHARYARAPHYYLNVLAVSPDWQGKGLASRLVRPVLERADEHSRGIYLDTMAVANVAKYKHFGFRIVEAYRVPKSDLTIWTMYRPPSGM